MSENFIKPRVVVHASPNYPFVERYIDAEGLMDHPIFKGRGLSEDEILHMVAKSQVPRGFPYWEVSHEELDAVYDPATRDAWVIDEEALGEPDGYGELDNV